MENKPSWTAGLQRHYVPCYKVEHDTVAGNLHSLWAIHRTNISSQSFGSRDEFCRPKSNIMTLSCTGYEEYNKPEMPFIVAGCQNTRNMLVSKIDPQSVDAEHSFNICRWISELSWTWINAHANTHKNANENITFPGLESSRLETRFSKLWSRSWTSKFCSLSRSWETCSWSWRLISASVVVGQ